MAFIKKSGSKFQVRHGSSNKVLSTFSKRSKAEKEVSSLHKEHNPKQKNRGASAKKRFK